MGRNLYIGDWHYNHANCIAFDNRPFPDKTAMNRYLIERWNGAVQPGDTVYVLGDMFWSVDDLNAAAILGQLNGSKVMVMGNHDRIGPHMTGCFQDVRDYLEIHDNGRLVVLSHYPVPVFRRMHAGAAHLYAHVHTGYEWRILEDTRSKIEALYERPVAMYNAGAMMPWMAYTPRTLDEIESGYASWKRLNDAMGPSSLPEIDRMLTLNTGHIQESTGRLLDEEPVTNALSLAVYRKAGTPDGESYGWFVHVPASGHWAPGMPQDLKRVLEYCRNLGCTFLCLDNDGPEDPALPVFEWDG